MSDEHAPDLGKSTVASGEPVLQPFADPHPATDLPEKIGKYEVLARLGRGGFGVVYKARDPQGQVVAIKVLRLDKPATADRIDLFRREANILASVDHPSIPRVWEVGLSDGVPSFIVTDYIAGGSLADLVNRAKNYPEVWPSYREAVELIEKLARTLYFAHQKGIMHRDIKPANILLDDTGQPYLADFGLALLDLEPTPSVGSDGKSRAGTPGYKSPEQAGGNSHLVDSRSDIYSLGVVLYELLAHKRPFFPGTIAEEEAKTKHKGTEVPPLRNACPDIPAELETACLKALCKDINARYTTALDFAEALARVIPRLPGPGPSGDTRMKFRRLGSYTADDSGFFLQLLPGQHAAGTLPDSIQSWKNCVEPTGAEQKPRRMCVLYGLSGCGKSSLMQAGVLPRLADHVLAIYLQATPHATETDLRSLLQDKCPDLAPELDLQQALQHLRDHGGFPTVKGRVKTKVLIVLDQFEQWLHGRKDLKNAELVQALRECDGARVQCLVMVRHDYFPDLTVDFFMAVGVDIALNTNWQVVQLLERDDARKILERFGKSLGKLPQSDDAAVRQQQADFLARAVDELAEDDKILCVRLALFIEIMRNKTWTPDALAAIGGIHGVGVRYLEQTFDSSDGPAHCRTHVAAVRQVMKALLPPPDKHIRDYRQTRSELLARARTVNRRYGRDPDYFQQLIHVLQHETPLITPVEAGRGDAKDKNDPEKYYQLTHDHLVKSIGQWLDNHLRKTKAGQAERLLMEREALWRTERAKRYLPSAFEYLRIRFRYPRRQWSAGERQMMRVAGRRHARRFTMTLLILLLIGLGLYTWEARNNVEKLLVADLDGVPAQVEDMAFYRPVADVLLAAHLPADEYAGGPRWYQWLVARVRRWYAPEEIDANQLLKVKLALLPSADMTKDGSNLADDVLETILDSQTPYANLGILLDMLGPYHEGLLDRLWQDLHDESAVSERRFRAGVALAAFQPAGNSWQDADFEFLAQHLMSINTDYQATLRGYLRPIAPSLIAPLEKRFDNLQQPELQHVNAANALADFAGSDPVKLAALLSRATAAQYPIVYERFQQLDASGKHQPLVAIVNRKPPDKPASQDRKSTGGTRAGAAITLLREGMYDAMFNALRVEDDPESLTQFVHRCRDRKVTSQDLLTALNKADTLRQTKTGQDRKRENVVFFGLLLALGEFKLNELPPAEQQPLVNKLANWYANDPSSAVHGATGWLLRDWGLTDLARIVDETPLPYSPDREWFVEEIKYQKNGRERSLYFTFIVFQAGQYQIGSPDGEPDGEPGRRNDESLCTVELTKPFAISDRPVTWAQFDAFDETGWRARVSGQIEWTPGDEEPAMAIPWETVRGEDEVTVVGGANDYCQWLTKQAKQVGSEAAVFQLPTEAQREIAARSGTVTSYSFGEEAALLKHYGWFLEDSGRRTHPTGSLRPNLRGLLDMHGGVLDWCSDWYAQQRPSRLTDPEGPDEGTLRVIRGGGWIVTAVNCRSAYRSRYEPDLTIDGLGFRVARVQSSQVERPVGEEQETR